MDIEIRSAVPDEFTAAIDVISTAFLERPDLAAAASIAPGGSLRLLLDAGPDGATCRATDRSPDLTLPVAALGGAYLGGTRLRDIVLATGVDEHRDGALARADALLRTSDEPGCSTFF